ncbi:MAG: HipA domain-containing protein [Pseudomonadota bacterium]
MMRLAIWLDRDLVAWLDHDSGVNRFALTYTPQWQASHRPYPLSPRLPLDGALAQTSEEHSAQVRQFFENLLPEGDALDHAAQATGTARSNLVGLLIALGKETAGALRVSVTADEAGSHSDGLRLVTPAQLSERIRKRAEIPFSVWDGKVRLSIAGYQDKIAVYEKADQWFLADGPRLASTVIVKPVPADPRLATLPANEFLCMQLAHRVGLDVAPTRLVHVPEPVLLVNRFDRVEEDAAVRRLHVIDGCQALGVSVAMKYERAYGDGRDVQHLRDGVSLPRLFRLLDASPQPARDKEALLRWALFQVLIGNTDAHGKNVSFFCDARGLRLAPAYDLVCAPALGYDGLSHTYAMAIGDAFSEPELSALEWSHFARQCGLPIRLVSQRLRQLAVRVLDSLDDVIAATAGVGVTVQVARAASDAIVATCRRQLEIAPMMLKLRSADL